MNHTILRFFFVGSATLLLCCSNLPAQITALVNANAKSYFAADNDLPAAQQSDPIGAPWGGSAGYGPYFNTPMSNVPAPPSFPLYPATLPASASFSSGHFSSFTYGLTNSSLNITANPAGGTNIVDARPSFTFVHNNPTSLYSYHQVNVAMDYLTSGPLGGMVFGGGALLYLASGTTTGLPGNYAEFGAKLNYFWAPVDSFGALLGTPSPIGSLEYVYVISNGGPYSSIVNATQASNLNPTLITGLGVLSVVGYAYVAGDPSSITLTPIPEPGTWALLAAGGLGLLAWKARRRRLAAV